MPKDNNEQLRSLLGLLWVGGTGMELKMGVIEYFKFGDFILFLK
jgi:hypothetical protein